jgi:WD40 repeat protein
LFGDPRLKANGWLESVVAKADFNRDSRVSRDEAIRRWARMRLDELAATKSIQAAAFSPDGSRIVSVTRDEHIQIWDTDNGELLGTAKGNDTAASSLALSSDGKILATCGGENVIKIWVVEHKRKGEK